MLLIGDSSSGKTGSLASLANAGYNLRIIDLDNGLDVLADVLSDPKSIYSKDALSKVYFETITDSMKNQAGKLIPGKVTVWKRTIDLLNNWKTESADFGPISSWTPQDVLVIDSLSFLCTAAMNFILSLNARLGQPPQQSDWYQAQQLIESLLQMLYDDGVKCNVIINCHITYIGEENGPQHGYPASLGKALSPKIGRYFNSVLMTRCVGQGSNTKRQILTNSTGMVELKTTAPSRVAASYPIETGLADYFKTVRERPATSGKV
jgi:hypothetical protein